MKKILVIVLSILLVFCIVYMFRSFSQPIVLDEDYINSEILIGVESINKILFVSKTEEYVACICKVDDQELMLLILKNNKYYDMHFRHSFSINSLTDNSQTVMTDNVSFEKSKISYNIFLNPKSNTVQIEGVSHKVNIIDCSVNQNNYQVGFWWFEVS